MSLELGRTRGLPYDASQLEKARAEMVSVQLIGNGISDQRVLAAMGQVPRHEFISPEQWDQAYDNHPLPIGYDQTISQPYTVAFMAQALQLRGQEKVLEIGAGSGYGAAVLGVLARELYTVERIPELAQLAVERLSRLGFDKVQVYLGDGTLGLPQEAPFDAIVVTASAQQVPPAYLEQLAEGGRLVIPVGETSFDQVMYRITRRGNHYDYETLGEFSFVPLVGEFGWHMGQSQTVP